MYARYCSFFLKETEKITLLSLFCSVLYKWLSARPSGGSPLQLCWSLRKFRHLKKETRGGICYSFSLEKKRQTRIVDCCIERDQSPSKNLVEVTLKTTWSKIYSRSPLFLLAIPSVWEGWHSNSRREHRPGRTLTRAPSLRVADAYNSACRRFRAFRRCSDPDTASSLKHSYRRAKQKH